MGRLAELLLVGADLLANEWRRLARAQVRVLRAAAFACVFAALLLVGLGFLVAAVYLALEPAVGPPLAALFTGTGTAVAGLLGLLLLRGTRG